MAGSRGLGKGLDALFQTTASQQEDGLSEGDYRLLPLASIENNPHQPRKQVSQEGLEELAQSIRQQGLLQPILVRPHTHKPGRYQIVAGERRWRACKQAELEQIPVLITRLNDTESLVIGLIENLQREDLNPMEESEALHTLISELEISQEALSEKIGRSRSSIANSLRLLQLDEDIQKALREGYITTGQARTLLAVADHETRMALFQRTMSEQLTVRTLEDFVAHWKETGSLPGEPSRASAASSKGGKQADRQAFAPDRQKLQKLLADRFATRVRISGGKDEGSISFKYRSEDELRTILSRFGLDETIVSRETE